MGAVRVTCGRTIARAKGLFSTALAVGGFLSAVALLFSLRLEESEGGTLSAVEVWAMCAAQFLPLLAAFLGMDVLCEERRSGRLDVLLATAVRERDLALGKFFGVWTVVCLAVLLSWLSSAACLLIFAPTAVAGVGLLTSVPALFGLAVQAFLWCAVAIAASALTEHVAVSLCTSVALTVGLPRGLWHGLTAWSAEGRVSFGAMPFDAHALDMASGIFSVGVLFGYLACSAVALFIAAKGIASARLVGRGAAGMRASTTIAVVLSLIAAVLSVGLAFTFDFALEIPLSNESSGLSQRTRSILAESSGDISVSCLLPRKSRRFRTVGRLLRMLKRQSESTGGAHFTLQYVDPHWDVGAAERLIGRGASDEGLVFRRGHRTVFLPLSEGCDERACATAIRRLSSGLRRCNVFWTTGHGERAFDEYGAFGLSDIARELAREGYRNRKIDLASDEQIPGDCALIAIAGARDPFSRVELGRIEAYLKEGGRLLVLTDRVSDGGVSAILPSWGLRPVKDRLVAASTLSGSDVVVSDFPESPLSASLKGARIVLESPVVFRPSSTTEVRVGADCIDFTPVALVGDAAVAVVAERGGGAGSDLAIRPTRIVAVGDVSFVMNGPLAQRANANRDFFLNCVFYLSGNAVVGGTQGDEADRLETSLDRRGRLAHAVWSAGFLPGLVALIFAGAVFGRRRRT